MKFRAKTQSEKISFFIKIVQTLQKINKECIIHFLEKRIRFILTSEITKGGVQVWSEINSSSLFDEYLTESLTNNEIFIELQLDNLQKAIKSANYSNDITLKLTKKNGIPYLSLIIENNQKISVIHDIPILVLSSQQFSQYKEPSFPDPEICIMMPPLKILRHMIDKMKKFGDHLTIFANMAGKFRISLESDMVHIATIFKNLENPQIEGKSPFEKDPNKAIEVKIDIEKFSRFLYSYQVGPTYVICCIIEGRAVIFYVLLDDFYLNYYIPILNIS